MCQTKKLIYTTISALVIINSVFAQIDTTSLSYYPLNDGDYWEYRHEIEDWIYPPGSYVTYYSCEVIGDTTLLAEETFKIIKKVKLDSTRQTSYLYERVDSVTCNVYRYDNYNNSEYLIDSLKSQVGDSCNATRTMFFDSSKTICTNIITDNILNQLTVSKIFMEQHWHAPIEYKLSSGFGLSYLHYYFDIGTFTQHLLYAVIDGVEYGTPVDDIERQSEQKIEDFYLYQNYPNPFNAQTTIKFRLPQTSYIELAVYSIIGEMVEKIVSAKLTAGIHQYIWDATAYASGLYYCKLISGQGLNNTRKLIVLK